jgi:hypothetical protein
MALEALPSVPLRATPWPWWRRKVCSSVGRQRGLRLPDLLSKKYVIKSKRAAADNEAEYRAYHRKRFDNQQFKSPNKKVA